MHAMLHQLIVGSLLIVVTVVVHAGCTLGVLKLFEVSSARGWDRGGVVLRSALVASVVLLLCYATLAEATVWAVFYVVAGALPTIEQSLYFSTVTFTTLGYGDVTLTEQWRLTASMEAANGILIFGWTTALVVALLQHVVRRKFSDHEA